MKNTIISTNNNDIIPPSPSMTIKSHLQESIDYFNNLIQKTLLSVQKYKLLDIIGANELNTATQQLEHIYMMLSNNSILLKNKQNINKVKSNLDTIRNDINNIFNNYGTENMRDLLNIVYGDEYITAMDWDCNKYNLIETYVHPINFKVIPWKNDRKNYSDKILEKNKIIEDFIIVEKSNNLDCFDLSRTSNTFQSKVYGIKIAFHNEKEKKTIIVAGLVDEILTSCINNDYLNKLTEEIIKKSPSVNYYEERSFEKYIQSLTLKEFIIYSLDEVLNKYEGYMNQVKLIKQKTISQVVKEFINDDLFGQRKTLIQLLLKSDEHEYQYLSYLLYDLLSNDNNGTIDTTEQTLLFDSLPWKIKSFFKDAMKQTISYTSNLSNFDNSKIPLEQQICLMKSSDNIKEKAMSKLKEVKSKSDDNGSKARTYLEGLLKIPFGIYKEEPILNNVTQIREIFKLIINEINKIDNNFIEQKDIYTNIEIKNFCEIIKNKYINNIGESVINKLITTYTSDKRNELIVNICNINNIIKKNKLKRHKLNHSGKKIEYMKSQIIEFINDIKTNDIIVNDLLNNKNIQNGNIIECVHQAIELIESKWKDINTYMNNVRDILNNAVHGHEKAKSQIERILAQWINGEQTGYSFGFEGPPGVGKTSFAKKGLARCLKDEEDICRPFSFIAIGGQDNGSTLNGHNYTYVGSEWGKFVDILIKNKCMNPIIFIDELDKVSKTEHGKEIIGILTHLIDPTQNDVFQDKYFNGIDLDMSKALFVFSYNDVSAIDKILLDRIHRIKFEHLSLEDKLVITRKHILPEIYKNMGLDNCIEISDDNIIFIIENYTNEPGIRKFKELLFEIIGEINLSCLKSYETTELPIKITNSDIKYKYLKNYHENLIKKIPLKPQVGVINGLWANSMGQGGIIPIEVKFSPNTSLFDLKLTGLQGDVMKESMTVAKTLASSLVETDKLSQLIKSFEITKMQGIHIHCPEGSVPKDGPSAGTAITTAIYSLLTGRKINNTIAITGEINLQGNISAIGGLDLKILGGLKGGVKEFIFPKENEKDYKDFVEKYTDKNMLENIKFHIVEHISQVLNIILED
uniref:Lon proteolytic domain-containing protein n=1 Tax=viral metagenome TaxID=1070528 RepID=A0A6C0CJN2_9ZZZZ